ncbi:MAG: UvrD-helicase domain-containing protein [Spirochaetia bacterium]|jgi:uncharacterized protein (TIGR00375 family)
MRLVADLHVHSRYSRATSREADLAGYYRWAQVKGIDIVGTGDFTHPRWFAELSSQLVEKDGLYVLKDPPRGSPLEGAAPADTPVRFMLTCEISSIYRKHGQVRKVHSLVFVPTLEDARRLNGRLAAIGNIASDGRPILGLDPKDLLSLVLETNADGFLIPAHIWTPWFSLFGSQSGFDRIEDCFEELTSRIFALETGLSSDPPMNWRWSALDRFRLVSNSDAHSPGNLGREANLLDAEPTWPGVADALRTGRGFLGTFEFYPEEGKYHFDGHRKCGVRMDPEQTFRSNGACPVCGKPVTVGVLNRVLSLADRRAPQQPRPSEGYRSLIPLPELLSEIAGVGAGSRAVTALYARIIAAFGSEYRFLLDADIEEITRSQGILVGEAVRRMREGRIDPRPGYDGEFGVIRVFDDEELERLRGQDVLFPAPGRQRKKREEQPPHDAMPGGFSPVEAPSPAEAPEPQPGPKKPAGREMGHAPAGDSGALDDEQRVIVDSLSQRGLVSAGPGSGKTRLLVGWIARIAEIRVPSPGHILALTFTNRAADELKDRLARVMAARAADVTAATFHSFSWSLLREHDPRLRTIFTPSHRLALLALLFPGERPAHCAALAERMERAWEGMPDPDPELRAMREVYEEELRKIGGADISSLVSRLTAVLRSDPGFHALISERFQAIAVDELQDINQPQYELLMQLCRTAGAVLCIGDPDQAIYGFRGSDRALFFRFRDENRADSFSLRRNYRSSATIVDAADALIRADRTPGIPPLDAMRPGGAKIRIVRAPDSDEEGRFIASAIRDLVGGVDSVSVDAVRGKGSGTYAFSDIAVLFRTRAVRDALVPALTSAGLPIALGSNTPLAEEEPFRSLVASLRLLINPSDDVSLHILRAHQAAVGVPGAVESFLAAGPGIARVAATEGICAAIDRIMGSVVNIDRSHVETALGEEIFTDAAARFGADLPGFLAHVSLCTRESEGPCPAQKISLLTFHAAKGLEFPVVFIAGAEERITPLPGGPAGHGGESCAAPGGGPAGHGGESCAAPGDNLAEERRLFYVAMTRARDLLYITSCSRRRLYGRIREVAPSRFLSEIPARLRDDQSLRTRSRQLTLF